MKIRKMKSNLDERQELKLLKIEHNGCWIAFWGLLIVMAIQMIVGNDSIKNLAGEWAVFMSLAYRNYHKLIGSIATGIIMFVQVEILCLLALMISSKIYKRRVQKLEEDE